MCCRFAQLVSGGFHITMMLGSFPPNLVLQHALCTLVSLQACGQVRMCKHETLQ